VVKPTSEDFEPRRDGWFEHRGTWDEVTLGTVIATDRRTQRWEIVEQAHGLQVEYGHTLWMRAREQTTGEEFTVKPRLKSRPVVILTQDPADTRTAPPTEPSDAQAISLLIERLGATRLASRDNETGEITCPDYEAGMAHPGAEAGCMAPLLEHLRFAHGMDTTHLDDLPSDERVREVISVHGRAHNPKYPDVGKGGFPHRHTPEQPALYT
jgi:hypothetical protein